jgi:carboxymethylenebutenolidase
VSTTQTLYPAYAQTNAAVLSNTNKLAPNNIITDTAPVIHKWDCKLIKSNTLTMLLATPTGKKLPAIIMNHEFWGINDNIGSMARTLAKQAGYVVLAVDLFKGQSTLIQIKLCS